jgi:hypothetical protein
LKQANVNSYLYNSQIIFLIILILSGCSGDNFDEDIAVKIYVENLIVEAKYISQPDSIEYYQKIVFDKYKISKEKFKKYFENLEHDQIRWNSFFKKADQYLIELRSNRAIE